MLPQSAPFDRRSVSLVLLACVAATSLVLGCDKVPLLAPTGSVITIFPTSNNVPSNGQMKIVATVIEQGVASTTTPPPTNGTPTTGTPTTGTTSTSTAGAGTPVQNGTVVTFTTTLGRIEPTEARTRNGQAEVTFYADGQSGTATITAFSGGASGKLENLKVGTAAAERVLLTASPQTLGPAGGSAEISARVEDVSGLGLVGVPVNFTTDAGTLSASSAVTDSNGIARTMLNTPRQAKVTANVAGKTAEVTIGLNPRTGLSLTAPTTQLSAGVPAVFTVNVGSTANVRDVTISWGDGQTQSLGAISASTTVAHTYVESGTYTVRATATDTSGFTEPVSTTVIVLPAQPPSVTITAPQSASVDTNVIVSANVSGATSTIIRYIWSFGPDATPTEVSTASRQTTVRWATTGTKTFSVRVIQASGPEGDQVASITIVR
jgi:Bacterial Ig-like domain (group 1)/PKD domain